jgi:hypothetical protein
MHNQPEDEEHGAFDSLTGSQIEGSRREVVVDFLKDDLCIQIDSLTSNSPFH